MNKSWRFWFIAAATAFVALAATAVFLLQNNIAKFLLSPRIPYQTYTPPEAPNYSSEASWALYPDTQEEAAADIFFLHSTTYYSRAQWNAPINDARSREELARTALPNEAGPFVNAGRVYAPRYRQATLFAAFTHKEDGREARQTAYTDARRAFEAFLSKRDPARPFIIAGYEQGGLHALRLLQEFVSEKPLRRWLAAAYIMDQGVPKDLGRSILRDLPACDRADAVRCIVSYTAIEDGFEDEARRTRNRSLVWTEAGGLESTAGRDLICVNPLTWTAAGPYAGSENHLGAAPATGLDMNDEPILAPGVVAAGCDEGVLRVDPPSQNYLRRKKLFSSKWKTQDFNLFYADLAANAQTRVTALQDAIRDEERAPPLRPVIDVQESPINPVP